MVKRTREAGGNRTVSFVSVRGRAHDTAEPDDFFIVSRLETLRVISDPFRVQIVDLLRKQPRTVKDLAGTLEVAPTKLYYHVNLLEEHQLIRVVATRVVSGILEKQYRATAYRLSVDRSLHDGPVASGDEALEGILSAVLDETRRGIRGSVAAGLVDPSKTALDEGGLILCRHLLRVSPARAAEFYARFSALAKEYGEPPAAATDGEARVFELSVALYPVDRPDLATSAPDPSAAVPAPADPSMVTPAAASDDERRRER
jgi:DNA-binding transcriptional ArsR family regulator